MSQNKPKHPGQATVDRFVEEMERYNVTVTRTGTEAVGETLEERADGTTVGVEFSWDGVSLPEHVNTEPTPRDLEAATVGITQATLGVASYGSLALRQDTVGSEPISLFVDTHIAVVREQDIVPEMGDAFAALGEELQDMRDSYILATGPSATADMGALVQGAHGPKEVEVIIHS
jgi:L-lactate dehydrogenase complex protein LldG